jgi:hypothetical protein
LFFNNPEITGPREVYKVKMQISETAIHSNEKKAQELALDALRRVGNNANRPLHDVKVTSKPTRRGRYKASASAWIDLKSSPPSKPRRQRR